MNTVWPAIARELNAMSDYRCLDWTSFTELGMIKQLHEALIKECEVNKPDALFMQVMYGGVIDGEIMKQLKLATPKTRIVNYTLDVVQPIPIWFFDVGKHIDLTLCCNENDVDEFNANGVKAMYMAPGYDGQLYTPNGSKSNYGEVVFLGNAFPEDDYKFPLTKFRADMVAHMKKNFRDKFKVYGHGYENSDGDLNHRGKAEAECYRSAKIALNASHFDLRRYSSDRIYRIMGSGCFCLTKWYPEIERDFVDGTHLRVWHTLDELVSLTEYYLDEKNDAERIKIAAAGHGLVKYRDTWAHRCSRLTGLMENI